MRRPLTGFRFSKVNTALLVAGAALLLVALLSPWVAIGGNQVAKTAPWWVPVVVGLFGVLAIVWDWRQAGNGCRHCERSQVGLALRRRCQTRAGWSAGATWRRRSRWRWAQGAARWR